MQWNYGFSYEMDIGRKSESYWVVTISPIPAMVSTLSTEMAPLPITSGSQFLIEFRVQHYLWDRYWLGLVQPKMDQYPQGCTFPVLKH